MSSLERVFVLSAYRIRLMIRSRSVLLMMLALPVFGGFILGMALRGGSGAGSGMFVMLPLSALWYVLLVRPNEGLLPQSRASLLNDIVDRESRALTMLILLAAQSVLYSAFTLAAGAGMPGVATVVAAAVLSIAVGIAASVLLARFGK